MRIAKRLLRALIEHTTEVVISLVLVLVFFMVSMGFLSTVLPRGSHVKNLVSYRNLASLTGRVVGLDKSLESGGFSLTEIATLVNLTRKVKQKPAGELAWIDTQPGMPLREHHAVQTFKRSGATIAFDDENELRLGENSLVVIKNIERTGREGGRKASMLVLGGELRGRLSGKDGAPLEMEIVMPNGTSNVGSADPDDGPTSFSVTLNKDSSSTFTVYEGAAEVRSGDGETIHVEANQAITVAKSGEATAPRELPTRPTLTGPEDRTTHFYRDQSPRVRFLWNGGSGAEEFYFEIARDTTFSDVVYETTASEGDLTHGNLKAGTYYWRTRGVKGDLRGAPSPPRRFQVVRDAKKPFLEAHFPEGAVRSDHTIIRGRAEIDSHVFVTNREVTMNASGEFEIELALTRGLNVVVVEAVDVAGNTSYRSQMIYADY